MKKAMYAFSGDPITYGHIDIVTRASKAFDKVVVGIGVNPTKNYTFSLEERTEMARRSLDSLKNVEVVSFRGLLVDYAYEHDIDIVVKGVRDTSDFTYENLLHQVGESQKLGIDTHILFAKPELAHVSSTAVKALQKEQGQVHEYVPLYVKQKLESKLSNQYVVGVTGCMGCGKSYVCKKFEELGKKYDIPVHNIELDYLGHEILSKNDEPKYEEVRNKVKNTFPGVEKEDGSIDRKALGEIVFNDYEKLKELNEIMLTPITVKLRREMHDKKGLILVNAALLAEADLGHVYNNNVVLVTADKDSQYRRLKERNLNEAQIERRLNSQYSEEEKKAALESKAKYHGNVWTLDNSDDSDPNAVEEMFNDVVRVLEYES